MYHCLKQPCFPTISSLYSPWSQKVWNIIQPLDQQQSVSGFRADSGIFHFHPRVLFYRYPDLCMSGCVCGGSCLRRFTNCVSCSVVEACSWPASWSVINCYFRITKWEEMLTNSYTLHWLKRPLTIRATWGLVSRVDAVEAFEND